MPIHDSKRIEFAIESGNIHISTTTGEYIPAYWSHPVVGDRFPGIALLHDWWGLTTVHRLLANFYAHLGYYVIAPDLFNGRTASDPQGALRLMSETETTRYTAATKAIRVLEHHHRTTHHTALIGLGAGGSLAFEAAIKRDDLDAVVVYAGFPQRYLKQLEDCKTPIMAIYGSADPYITTDVLQALRTALTRSPRASEHQVRVIAGAGHTFFSPQPVPEEREWGKEVINLTLAFLEDYLERPDMRLYTQY